MSLPLTIRQCVTAAAVGILAVGGVVTATASAAPGADDRQVDVTSEFRPDGRQL
jgi:hypothetical protein